MGNCLWKHGSWQLIMFISESTPNQNHPNLRITKIYKYCTTTICTLNYASTVWRMWWNCLYRMALTLRFSVTFTFMFTITLRYVCGWLFTTLSSIELNCIALIDWDYLNWIVSIEVRTFISQPCWKCEYISWFLYYCFVVRGRGHICTRSFANTWLDTYFSVHRH